MSVGVLFLAKNEAHQIRTAIESVRCFADEIVVIDDNSSDNTVDIAESLGATVYKRAMNRNFSEQYMFGFSKLDTDWIFIMDADEIVPEETGIWIKENIFHLDYEAYTLWRQNFVLGHKIYYGGSRTPLLRLFRNGKVSMSGKVHSKFYVQGKIGNLDLEVYHYPLESISKMIDKINLYTQLQIEQGDLNNLSLKELKSLLLYRPLKLFWKNYIKKKGYKDGIYGLIWCLMNIIGPELLYLKAVEKKLKEQR